MTSKTLRNFDEESTSTSVCPFVKAELASMSAADADADSDDIVVRDRVRVAVSSTGWNFKWKKYFEKFEIVIILQTFLLFIEKV